MDRELWKIHLSKDSHKFSSTHLTIFPGGLKERLHGHNYRVDLTVELTDVSFEKMIPFSSIKGMVRTVCDAFDERILIAGENPFVASRPEGSEVEFVICGARYVFPADEVVILPLENITVELLTKEVADRILEALERSNEISPTAKNLIISLEVRIEETDGQAASYVRRRGIPRA